MSTITCAEFDRWLDAGAAAFERPVMSAHAATCERCTRALRAMETIDAWLDEGDASSAPAGFTDQVMLRVAGAETARVRGAAPLPMFEPEPLPWWAVVLRQPATVLAALLAGLVVWQMENLTAAAGAFAGWVATAVTELAGNLSLQRLAMGDNDLLLIGLITGLAPVLTIASFALGRLAARADLR